MREVLIEKRKLILEDIAFTVSRMVKDHDSPEVRGMTEIGIRWISQLNDHLTRLDSVDKEISDSRL